MMIYQWNLLRELWINGECMSRATDFCEWYSRYHPKNREIIVKDINTVEVYGDEIDVLWMTVKCDKCVVQATCFSHREYIRKDAKGYDVINRLATIQSICLLCLKHMVDFCHYIKDYRPDYTRKYLEIELLPRYPYGE